MLLLEDIDVCIGSNGKSWVLGYGIGFMALAWDVAMCMVRASL